MKRLFILSAISTYFLLACSTSKRLSGSYVYNNGIELSFTENPNQFEYFMRGEAGLLQYSAGEWTLNGNKAYLSGFTDKNKKMIDVGSDVVGNAGGADVQVKIFYKTEHAVTYIKSVVIINEDSIYNIAGDTAFSSGHNVETIQVKSYLSYQGLLSSPPKIDTLSSRKIKVDAARGKTILLKFSVNAKDFYRTPLADTLTVRNSRTLLYKNLKLKKLGPAK